MKSVLVTGASTGIGRACAERLDGAGWRVFAGVRKQPDADSLREAGSERLVPLILDVTDAGQIAAAAERIGGETGEAGLDGLVNNAGIAIGGPLETLPIDDFRRQIEVNLTAHVAVTQAMLPAIRRARGRIVFITSIGGLMAVPMFGAYHAAKFGLEAVGDVFRQELRQWGISVSIVEPGSIATPIWERGQEEVDAIAERVGDGHAEPLRRGDGGVPRDRAEDRRARHSAREGRQGGRARAERPAPPRPLPGRARRPRPGFRREVATRPPRRPDSRPRHRQLTDVPVI